MSDDEVEDLIHNISGDLETPGVEHIHEIAASRKQKRQGAAKFGGVAAVVLLLAGLGFWASRPEPAELATADDAIATAETSGTDDSSASVADDSAPIELEPIGSDSELDSPTTPETTTTTTEPVDTTTTTTTEPVDTTTTTTTEPVDTTTTTTTEPVDTTTTTTTEPAEPATTTTTEPVADEAPEQVDEPTSTEPEEPEVGYIRPDIVTVRGFEVSSEIADQFEELLAAAEDAGLSLTGYGFRDPQHTIELRMEHCGTTDYAIYEMPPSECDIPTARPGQSQHELGLAIDFLDTWQDSANFTWLSANAATYGFFTNGTEAWHWSTTGN